MPLASLDVDGSAEQDAGSDAEKVHGAIKVCTVEITERHRKQDQYLSAHAPIATRNQQLIDRFLDLPENHHPARIHLGDLDFWVPWPQAVS